MMEYGTLEEMPEYERRCFGNALLRILNQLKQDPEAMEKIRARAAENERRRTG